MENTGKEAIFVYIEQAIKETQQIAAIINRGPGGPEMTLTMRKLQEAEDWVKRSLEEVRQAK